MVVEVALAVVAFGCARWGSSAVVWLSGVSIPVAAAIAVALLDASVLYDALDTAGIRVLARPRVRRHQRLARACRPARHGPADGALAARVSPCASPRGSQASRASQVVAEAERDQAEEIARLREDQARLARDVHDVVGHSLAVILAQAESAQYLDDADTAGLKRTMANIATSARSSLDDVRTVLAIHPGRDHRPGAPARPGEPARRRTRQWPHRRVDRRSARRNRCRRSSRWWRSGCCRRCSPTRSSTVDATSPCWSSGTGARTCGSRCRTPLRRTIASSTRPSRSRACPPMPSEGGQGIDGMRRRLEAVGGRLDVRRRTDPPTFTATAWVPVRVVS